MPQGTQMLLLHRALAELHVPVPPAGLSQQGEPRSPQLAQVPALHLVSGAVHVAVPVGPPPQQG